MKRETINRSDFQVQQVARGQWQVTYEHNGRTYTGTTNDAELIDEFKRAGAEPWVNEPTPSHKAWQQVAKVLRMLRDVTEYRKT